jgi:hypothetical protein
MWSWLVERDVNLALRAASELHPQPYQSQSNGRQSGVTDEGGAATSNQTGSLSHTEQGRAKAEEKPTQKQEVDLED